MKSIAVIAIGSRIMKDDGIGVWVAEAIRNTLSQENVDVVIAETDFEYGFEAARTYNYVIVLDAMFGGDTPGEIKVLPFSDAKIQRRYATQHDMNLIDLIAHEGNLSGSLIGIEAKDVDFGYELSKTLREKFEAICGDVQRAILKIMEDFSDA